MKITHVLILVLLTTIVMFSGCTEEIMKMLQGGDGGTTQATTTQPFCPDPYIEFKTGECCLDADGNRICDTDETTQATTRETTQATTQATTRATSQATSQGTTTPTTAQQRCRAGYYDNDESCADACADDQKCAKSGLSVTYNNQKIYCYECKQACVSNDPDIVYNYKDNTCNNACNQVGYFCFESTTQEDCYYCGKPCPDGYFYQDDKCNSACGDASECTKSTQTNYECYWCKSPCVEGMFYKDTDCAGTCDIHQNCIESYDDCYNCARACDVGYYYNDASCESDCGSGESCLKLLGQNCYYCGDPSQVTQPTTQATAPTTTIVQVGCGGDLYDSSNCDGDCDNTCEDCNSYPGTPCYYCEDKDCDDIGLHLYDDFGDCMDDCWPDGECNVSDECDHCYECEWYECGNGVIEGGEQCEDDFDCPDYHYCDLGCECVSSCTDYCDDQGVWGYTHIAGIGSQAACQAKMNADIAALRADCRAVCGAYAWMSGLTADCCCVETDWLPCLNCPNQNPAAIDCDTPLAQCSAGL